MQIKITNADEAGMPNEMVKHCEQLLEWKINKTPSLGDEIEILYSETDPLMEKEGWGMDAYGIYFTAATVEPAGEKDVQKLAIQFDLVF